MPERHPDPANYGDLIEECNARAIDWADAHGLELADIGVHVRGTAVGVAFDVVVGKGELDSDQRMPGSGDRWRWSGRAQWWQHVLGAAMPGKAGRTVASRAATPPNASGNGLATVTRIHARTGLEPGCTCHIGGPFTDICPIHFQADT
ncbi:hypothetical protein I5G60_gp67 [Mycobacterium phage Saguaro]|uniref:Uncharacterized protein n=1 Tax=Mycobacterium phage Saguaro TaxID=2315616 RepID=A0A386K9J1_9CAUD|nr:hypothetical protein I5G60_gp67 [Mycobacterium phage Saguaro]AYD82061.1 hypothetical protein SEA_SAGUARO_67 [Mycobacterium phage Saguaro]